MADDIAETEADRKPTETFHFDNGATYTGEFKYLDLQASSSEEVSQSPVRHGFGTYTEGAYSYEGYWSEDQMEGRGKFSFASGSSYEGGFRLNKYHGEGTFTWADGSAYTGAWQDGKMHGLGSYVDKDGQKWDGQFYNGVGPGLKRSI